VTTWALMEKLEIMDIADRSKVYLRRWRIFQCPWFGVFIHKIMLPDPDRGLHDHPWPFGCFILKGGYVEAFKPGAPWPTSDWVWRTGWGWARRWHTMRRGEFHRITRLLGVPTWTLIFVGRRQGDWGYLTPDGWVSHEDFHRTLGLSELDRDF
jgi:hypothetical protein